MSAKAQGNQSVLKCTKQEAKHRTEYQVRITQLKRILYRILIYSCRSQHGNSEITKKLYFNQQQKILLTSQMAAKNYTR